MINKELKFKVTIGNSKLGSICAINLPAIKTCREDAPCKKKCYARKGTFNFPSVKNCYERNLDLFLQDSTKVKNDILEQLPYQGFCRVFASGDFVNMDFLKMIVEIAETLPNMKFMAFTKKYEMINTYVQQGGNIPSNLKIIFSIWHGLDCYNPYAFPTAIVNLKEVHDKRIFADAIPCSGKCDKCFICWKLDKGEQVIFEEH